MSIVECTSDPSPRQRGCDGPRHRGQVLGEVAGTGGSLASRLAEIEQRFRRSSLRSITFYANDSGARVHVALTRSQLDPLRIERVTVPDAGFHGLTLLEHEIATAVALGFGNEEIGLRRGTSRRTIDRQVSTILARLSLQNRTQLAAFVAATEGWLVPFPEQPVLETRVPALRVLGLTPSGREAIGKETGEAHHPTLLLGSLLPSDEEKQQDALAMSRGEDLAASGPPTDRAPGSRLPVRILRRVVPADELDNAIESLATAGIQALMIGNFDIPTARRILEHDSLRGTPIVHSMVNKHVDVFTGPDPAYEHIFQMCADEFVYLRALAAYLRGYAPEARRLAVLIRGSDRQAVTGVIRSSLGDDSAVDIQIIGIDDGHGNLAEIALELLHFSPEVVYLGVYVESTLNELVSHIRDLRLAARLFCVWVPGIPGFVQRNPRIAEGLVWSTLVGNSNNYYGVRFRAAFETAYRSNPGIGAAAVHYDMVNLLRRAWQDTGLASESGALAGSLNSVQFTGVTGTFHFDNGRRRTLCYPFDTDDPSIGQPCLTFTIKDGKSVPLPLTGLGR